MSMKIDEYLNSIQALTQTAQSATISGNTGKTESKTGDGDSYIASAADSSAVLPSENYNDILKVMQNAKAGTSGSSTSSEGSGTSAGNASGGTSGADSVSGGNGGNGGSGDSEEETTTQVVTINGVTYLETTTVTDGVTTVSRTVIGGTEEK